jgi:transcriptional repressor NrdR
MEILGLAVVKRDGRREPYNKEKLENGLKKALEKRSYTQESFQQLVTKIERDIQKLRQDEVRAAIIGELIMKHLKRFDKVAYIRFASVYRSFADVKTFQKEISNLVSRRKQQGR